MRVRNIADSRTALARTLYPSHVFAQALPTPQGDGQNKGVKSQDVLIPATHQKTQKLPSPRIKSQVLLMHATYQKFLSYVSVKATLTQCHVTGCTDACNS